jgi:N-methylhydantoinase B/oxoprolinase/acetone carboxylase alpha subunit
MGMSDGEVRALEGRVRQDILKLDSLVQQLRADARAAVAELSIAVEQLASAVERSGDANVAAVINQARTAAQSARHRI